MKRILILACSATKMGSCPGGKIPAWNRYDGPAWRTFRANVDPQEHGRGELDVYALSAEHGLIPGETKIADYDRRMTPARAAELEKRVAIALEQLPPEAAEIFAYGGGIYRDLLERARGVAEEHSGRDIPIAFTRGGIGEQLGQLKEWLRREAHD